MRQHPPRRVRRQQADGPQHRLHDLDPAVGLQRLVNEEGNAEMLMQMGLGVVGAQFSNQSEATLDQATAR